MKTLYWIVVLFGFGIGNTFLFCILTIFQLHQELDTTLHRVQEDIVYTDGTWDTTLYNADPLLPGNGPLYILSQDGYVIERWKPITGFLDSSDFKHLLAFSTPQTIQTDTNQEWRVYSRAIEREGQTVGVINVSVYQPAKENVVSLDAQLQQTAQTILERIEVKDSQLKVLDFDQRTIAHYLSYQVVDKSNTLIFKSNNSNSIDRLPNFIDPSYVASKLKSANLQLVVDSQTRELFITKSEPLHAEANSTQGIIVAGRSLQALLTTVQLQIVVLSLGFMLSLGCVWLFSYYKKKHAQRQQQGKKLHISFDPKESVIKINEQEIPIAFASNQYYLCDAVFRKKMKRWEVDELLEKFGEEFSSSGWRTVYDATNQINKKTKAYLPGKLILADEKTYRLNPAFI